MTLQSRGSVDRIAEHCVLLTLSASHSASYEGSSINPHTHHDRWLLLFLPALVKLNQLASHSQGTLHSMHRILADLLLTGMRYRDTEQGHNRITDILINNAAVG